MRVIDVEYRVKVGKYRVMAISGDSCRAVRKMHRVSQDQFARTAGISPVTLREFEKGRTAPNFSTILKIAKTLQEIGKISRNEQKGES